jgi:hypothetical protein
VRAGGGYTRPLSRLRETEIARPVKDFHRGESRPDARKTRSAFVFVPSAQHGAAYSSVVVAVITVVVVVLLFLAHASRSAVKPS